jgi:hypothetical protein
MIFGVGVVPGRQTVFLFQDRATFAAVRFSSLRFCLGVGKVFPPLSFGLPLPASLPPALLASLCAVVLKSQFVVAPRQLNAGRYVS